MTDNSPTDGLYYHTVYCNRRTAQQYFTDEQIALGCARTPTSWAVIIVHDRQPDGLWAGPTEDTIAGIVRDQLAQKLYQLIDILSVTEPGTETHPLRRVDVHPIPKSARANLRVVSSAA